MTVLKTTRGSPSNKALSFYTTCSSSQSRETVPLSSGAVNGEALRQLGRWTSRERDREGRKGNEAVARASLRGGGMTKAQLRRRYNVGAVFVFRRRIQIQNQLKPQYAFMHLMNDGRQTRIFLMLSLNYEDSFEEI